MPTTSDAVPVFTLKGAGLDLIGTNFNQDTYFSVSLLNRSLA